MRRLTRALLLSGATTLLSTTASWGQSSVPRPEVDLAVTYTAQHSNLTTGQFFWLQGGSFELAPEVSHGFGIAMNIAGQRASNILGTGVDLNLITPTFGPRYTWHKRNGRVAVFGQSLIGESIAWNSFFPATGGPVSSYDTFALHVGGGVDLRLSRHFAVRPVQAAWLRTEFPNATTSVQNNLLLNAGLVLRLH